MYMMNHFKDTHNSQHPPSPHTRSRRFENGIENPLTRNFIHTNQLFYNELNIGLKKNRSFNFAEKRRKTRKLPKISRSCKTLETKELTSVVPKNRKKPLFCYFIYIYIILYPFLYYVFTFIFKGGKIFGKCKQPFGRKGDGVAEKLRTFSAAPLLCFRNSLQRRKLCCRRTEWCFSAKPSDFRRLVGFRSFDNALICKNLRFLFKNDRTQKPRILLNKTGKPIKLKGLGLFLLCCFRNVLIRLKLLIYIMMRIFKTKFFDTFYCCVGNWFNNLLEVTTFNRLKINKVTLVLISNFWGK